MIGGRFRHALHPHRSTTFKMRLSSNNPEKKLAAVRQALLDSICLNKPITGPFEIYKSTSGNAPQVRALDCPYTKEEIEHLYLDKGMSRSEIAKHYGITYNKLRTWMGARKVTLGGEHYQRRMGQDRRSVVDSHTIKNRQRLQHSHKNKSTMNGYMTVFNPSHPANAHSSRGLIMEHRHIIERQLKRFLKSDEQVHHINYNKQDNREINLIMCTPTGHRMFHNYMEDYGAYAAGLTKKPKDMVFDRPVFWNGSWYDTLSIEDLKKAIQVETVH